MHLASIMGTRTLSFFPSFPPCSKERWGCYNEENAHYLVPDIKCPVKRCNKACMYYNCIDGFKHDYVLERIVKIIG